MFYMKKISLSLQGKNKGKYFAIVDEKDFNKVSKIRWHIHNEKYARSSIGNKRFMHRFILGVRKEEYIDHINGIKLDNRRKNLRICTNSENMRNRGAQKNNKLGIKGVSFHKLSKKYEARIFINNKKLHLGLFTSKKFALIAYNKAAIKYHGKFARLNKLSNQIMAR